MTGHSEGAAGRGSILVADDNRLVQISLREILRRFGFDPAVVSDGRSALEALQGGGYEMVFLDLQMPVVNGLDCIREIRRREGKGAAGRLPVVVITGNPVEEVQDECHSAGADDVLTKPFTVEKLADVLERWLPSGDSAPSPAPFPEGRERAPIEEPAQVSVSTERIAEIRHLEAQGSANLMRRMVDLYRTGSAKLIEELGQALRDGDAEALAVAAHELKSSSGSVGGTRLHMLCTDMERLGRQGLLGGAEGLVSLIQAEHALVLGVLSKEVSTEND
jgi:CheY-like chemotaxis protein/HPt (histidine-containing phosphotransfer) domain-containing protein